MKELQAELADLKETTEAELIAGEVSGTVDYNGWTIVVVDTPGTPKLDKKKLLSLLGPDGVQLLKRAMTPGKPSHFVRLTPPDEKPDEEEENA